MSADIKRVTSVQTINHPNMRQNYLQSLMDRESELEKELFQNKSEQKQLNAENWLFTRQLKVGDTVVWFYGSTEMKSILESFLFNSENEVSHCIVRAIRVSGLPSTKTYKIYPSDFASIKKLK